MKNLIVIITLVLAINIIQYNAKIDEWNVAEVNIPRRDAKTAPAGQISPNKGVVYEITAYCLNKNPMASGLMPYDGAVACPRNIPLKTKIIITTGIYPLIDFKKYTCEDRMALKYRNGNYIDIWFEDCPTALNFGRQELLVNIK